MSSPPNKATGPNRRVVAVLLEDKGVGWYVLDCRHHILGHAAPGTKWPTELRCEHCAREGRSE